MFFMPDNLRITTPINNTQGLNQPNPVNEPSQTPPVNPSRVPRPSNSENAGNQQGDLLLDRTSVYSQFIRQLEKLPVLESTLQKILSEAVAVQSPQGGEPLGSLPVQLRGLITAMAAQEDGMLKSIVNQQKDSSLFTGPLFKLLGQISAQSSDPQFDLRLADFLKAYTGYTTSVNTMQAIRTELTQLKYSIPIRYAKQLSAVMEKLSDGSNPSMVKSDLIVLKKEIIPLLGEYVSKTNDYGKSRDTISMLLNNTAILNESTKENLGTKFSQLIKYSIETLGLPEMTVSMIKSLFAEDIATVRQEENDRFLSALTSLLSHISEKGASGGVDKSTLHDILHSLLLDSSVFMPFQHIILPAQVDGRFIFSQIWIEKQDPDKAGNQKLNRASAPKFLYLTFDIQDLGYFETSIRLTGRQVDMKLSCPPPLEHNRGQIRSDVSAIMRKNGFTAGDIRLSTCEKPKMPQIIMQKIRERKRAVDVTV